MDQRFFGFGLGFAFFGAGFFAAVLVGFAGLVADFTGFALASDFALASGLAAGGTTAAAGAGEGAAPLPLPLPFTTSPFLPGAAVAGAAPHLLPLWPTSTAGWRRRWRWRRREGLQELQSLGART